MMHGRSPSRIPAWRKEQALWEDRKAANFAVPTSSKVHPIAQRWGRAKSAYKELAARYEAAAGNRPLLAKLRSEWAREVYRDWQKNQPITEKVVVKESEAGSLLPPGRIAWLEGSGFKGFRNMVHNVTICFDMGTIFLEVQQEHADHQVRLRCRNVGNLGGVSDEAELVQGETHCQEEAAANEGCVTERR